MAKPHIEEPIGIDEPTKRSAASFLDRLSETLLAENTRGYLIRFITEPLPLLGIWSLGDILGFLTGWRDYRYGSIVRGTLKMITAGIPGVPTIPLHVIIDKIMPAPNRPQFT